LIQFRLNRGRLGSNPCFAVLDFSIGGDRAGTFNSLQIPHVWDAV
jgi:hypothetical protein